MGNRSQKRMFNGFKQALSFLFIFSFGKFFASGFFAPRVQLCRLKKHFIVFVFFFALKFKAFIALLINIVNNRIGFGLFNFFIFKETLLKLFVLKLFFDKFGIGQSLFGTCGNFLFFFLFRFKGKLRLTSFFQLFRKTGIIGSDHFQGFFVCRVISVYISAGNLVSLR